MEAWLADEGEGARAGDGQRRQGDAGGSARAGGGAQDRDDAGGAGGIGENLPRPGGEAPSPAGGPGGARVPETAAPGAAGAGGDVPEEGDVGGDALTRQDATWVDPSRGEALR